MAATQLEMCNMAILDVGGNTISQVSTGNQKEEKLCYNYWDHMVDTMLAAHNWNFAKKWLSLTEDTGYTFVDDQYEYAWEVPSDFIRFADQENRGPAKIDFARRANRFLTNTDEFEIEYIYRPADITVTTTYPPWYIDAFVAKLKVKLATSLARKGSTTRNWVAEYHEMLATAKHMNAMGQDESVERKTRHTDSNDTWLSARG
jgi:hypothetical protein